MSDHYGFIELEYETLIKDRDKYLNENEVFLKSGTFEALRDRICKENEIIQSFYKQANDLYKAKVDSRKYNEEYLKETKKDLHKEVEDYANERKQELSTYIMFTINEARERVDNALVKQPTVEQSTLINMAKYNNKLTQNEIKGMLSQFADNYFSIRTFQSILEEKGIYLHLPKSYDYDEMLKSLDYASQYFNRVMFDFGKERKEFTQTDSTFFYWKDTKDKDKWNKDPIVVKRFYDPIVNVLDKTPLTSPKIDIVNIASLSNKERKMFYEIINTDDVKTIINKIKESKSDNLSKVLSQMPDYKAYINQNISIDESIKDTQKGINKVMKTLEDKQQDEDSIAELKEAINKHESKGHSSVLGNFVDDKGDIVIGVEGYNS